MIRDAGMNIYRHHWGFHNPEDFGFFFRLGVNTNTVLVALTRLGVRRRLRHIPRRIPRRTGGDHQIVVEAVVERRFPSKVFLGELNFEFGMSFDQPFLYRADDSSGLRLSSEAIDIASFSMFDTGRGVVRLLCHWDGLAIPTGKRLEFAVMVVVVPNQDAPVRTMVRVRP